MGVMGLIGLMGGKTGGDGMSKRAELEGVHRVYRENCGEWEFFRTAYWGGA